MGLPHSSPQRPAGQGGWQGRCSLSGHPFAPLFLLPLQNNILVVKDDSNHPMSVVSSTKSRWVMKGDSCYSAGRGVPPANPSISGDTKVPPDPPKWALTPFSPPTPPDWPCSTGMDTSWITSASPSLTTSSRANSTSTPPAKHQRPCSEAALVSRLPTALHHFFLSLSLSPCLHLSPHPMASCPCLPLTPSANAPSCSNVQGTAAQPRGEWFGLFFRGTALPLLLPPPPPPPCTRAICSVCSRGGGSGTPLPSMSLGNGPPGPSSQHAQSRGFLFHVILQYLSSINLGGLFFS